MTVRRVVRQLPAGPFGIQWKWKVCRYVAFIKFCPLQRLSFGERDRRSRLNSSRRWSVISPSLHGSPMVVCSFWMDGFAVLTSWNLQEFCWIVMHSVGFKVGLTGFRRFRLRCLFSRLQATHRISARASIAVVYPKVTHHVVPACQGSGTLLVEGPTCTA